MFAVVVGLAALTPRAGHAQEVRRQVLVGTVRDSSGVPVGSGEVIVTAARTFSVSRGVIQVGGRFRVVVDSGTGDYLVVASALGFRSERQRATLALTRDSIVLEFVLRRSGAQALAAVAVNARRPTVNNLNTELGARGGASEQLASEAVGGLSAADAGDLNATALLSAGFSSTASGVGVLGLAGDQTRVTINGLPVVVTSMPRDMRRRVRVGTTNYDPAIGGYSGGAIEVELRRGSTLNNPRSRISHDGELNSMFVPSVQTVGGPRTMVSYTNSGEAKEDAVFYNLGASVTHRATQQLMFGSEPSRSLESSGIITQYSALASERLRDAGIPFESRSRGVAFNAAAEALGRIDWMKSRIGPLALTVGAGLSRPEMSSSPLANATTGVQSSRSNASLQLSSNQVTSTGWRVDWRLGSAMLGAREQPIVDGPSIALWIPSDSNSDLLGRFGGSGQSEQQRRRVTVEGAFEAERIVQLPGRGRHQLKAFLQQQSDLSSRRSFASSGTYLFGSFDDVVNRAPIGYSRTLDDATRNAAAMNVGFGVGDAWRVNRFLLLQLGIRADVGGSIRQARPDRELQQALGLRQSQGALSGAPLLSPRLGFSWTYQKERAQGASTTSTQSFGTLAFPGSGTLRGGIGLFRNYWSVDELLATAALGDGVGTRALLCNAGQVPPFKWFSSAATAPTTCSRGNGSGVARRSGAFLPTDAAPQAAWRGNLLLSHPLRKRMSVELGLVSSFAFNQRSPIDRNLPSSFADLLPGEANRATYLDFRSIDPMTGLPTQNPSRPIDSFGQVLELDMRGKVRTNELSLGIHHEGWHSIAIRLNSTIRSSQRFGSDFGATGARTGTSQWTATPNLARSRTVLEANRFGRRLAFGGLLVFEEGARFTPLVSGDVNGDGNTRNDRAFVSADLLNDPAARSFTRAALRCLVSQRDAIASVASCPMPSMLRADLAFSITPKTHAMSKRGGGRAAYTVRLVNATALLDQWVNSVPRGWGASSAVDPVLASVRSFDPVTRQYGYIVNRSFGRTLLNGASRRASYLLSFDAQIYLGRSIADQEAIKTIKRSRVGAARSGEVAELTARIRTTFRDPYQEILEAGDSLLLQRTQVEEIVRQQKSLQLRVDSLWERFAERAVDRDAKLSEREAGELLQMTYTEVIRTLRSGVQPLKTILLAPQLTRVPASVAALLAGRDPTFYLR